MLCLRGTGFELVGEGQNKRAQTPARLLVIDTGVLTLLAPPVVVIAHRHLHASSGLLGIYVHPQALFATGFVAHFWAAWSRCCGSLLVLDGMEIQ